MSLPIEAPLTVTLRNGIKMPKLGLGLSSLLTKCTFLLPYFLMHILMGLTGTTHHGGYNHDSVLYAIQKCGYRLIDTAKRYGEKI